MKGTVFAQREVKDVLKEFVFAELYTDAKPWKVANAKLLKERFKSVALPFYVTLGPDGVERSRLEGLASTAEFLAFLRKGLNQTSLAPPAVERALGEARRTGKRVLLQFTDLSSLNSTRMAGTVLAQDSVREVLADFITVELPVDHGPDREVNAAFQRLRFQTVARPTYATLDPDGKERSRLLGLSSEAEFLAFLRKGLNQTAMK